MLQEDPLLAKSKDFTNGYTALHWAAKRGNLDLGMSINYAHCTFH